MTTFLIIVRRLIILSFPIIGRLPVAPGIRRQNIYVRDYTHQQQNGRQKGWAARARGYSSALINTPRGARNGFATLSLSLDSGRLASRRQTHLRFYASFEARPTSPSPKTPSTTRSRPSDDDNGTKITDHEICDAEKTIYLVFK